MIEYSEEEEETNSVLKTSRSCVLFFLPRFHIYEEVDVGSDVGTVVAVDMDSGDLGEVVYSISDSDKLVTTIVASTPPETTGVIVCLDACIHLPGWQVHRQLYDW